MSVRIVVRPDMPSLCERCAYATVARRASCPLLVRCSSFNQIMPADIVECWTYMPIGTQPPRAYAQPADAIIIDTRPSPGQVV